MATGASEINADPGCGRTTDPDMAQAAAQARTMPWVQVAALVIQVMGLVVTQPLETNRASDGGPDPGHPCGPLVATLATDINTHSGYGRTTDSDVVLGRSLGPDVLVVLTEPNVVNEGVVPKGVS